MLRVLVARPAAAIRCNAHVHRPSQNMLSRCLWMGGSHKIITPPSPHANHAARLQRHKLCPIQLGGRNQHRNYIFLPSTLSDASKLMKNLFDTNRQTKKRLMVKVRSRWQDTLLSVQERIQLIKTIQRKQRKMARQRANAATSSLMMRSGRYSRFVENVHGNVGRLSSVALSKGKKNLLSHYNAKRRVYARRKIAMQLARKVNGSVSFMDRWKLNSPGEDRWGWLSSGLSNATTGTYTAINTGSTTWKGVTLMEPAQQSWFDEEGYPLTSRDPETGRFVNPWLSESTNGEHGLKKFLKWKLGGPWCRFLDAIGISSDSETRDKAEAELRRKTPGDVASLKYEINSTAALADSSQSSMRNSSGYELPTPSSHLANGEEIHHTSAEGIDLTWIGHSSTFVTFPGNFTILTDPHFSNYAGPVRRNAPPAFGVADLPELVDCVLISHDHMDHLDYWSILELIDSNKVKYWIVPLGIKAWLMDQAGISPEDIVELEWWEGVRLSKPPIGAVLNGNRSEMRFPEMEGLVRAFDNVTGQRENGREEKSYGIPDKNELVVTCAPAQHWCSRSPFDRNRRLWCSFAVHATPAYSQSSPQTHAFYFAGDTGLPPEFPLHQQIGDRLGPFDISAIPIGAYEPEWFMRESHCNPVEAVKIHQAVQSCRSVAIHFNTFDLADEPTEEPPKLLMNEVVRVNEEIAKLAAEVVAVVNDVDVANGLKQLGGQSVLGETMKGGAACAVSSLSVVEQEMVSEANERLIEMISPLVDFAAIEQGHNISSVRPDSPGRIVYRTS